MSSQHKLCERMLSEMKNFLANEKQIGQAAPTTDMRFLADGAWLKDAAVIDLIGNNQGAWNVSLIFAHYKNPLQLIIRNITRCFSEQKAKATAFYLSKEAAKDRRGTLYVSIDDLHLCYN